MVGKERSRPENDAQNQPQDKQGCKVDIHRRFSLRMWGTGLWRIRWAFRQLETGRERRVRPGAGCPTLDPFVGSWVGFLPCGVKKISLDPSAASDLRILHEAAHETEHYA